MKIQNNGGKLLVEDPWGADVESVINSLRSMKAKNPDLRCAIVDHFHVLARHKGAPQSEAAMLEERAYKLMNCAKQLEIDLIVLAQMNRVGMDSVSKKEAPTLDQIRGTDALSHVSHAVWIVRKEVEKVGDEEKWTGGLEFWHAKTRGRQARWTGSKIEGIGGFLDQVRPGDGLCPQRNQGRQDRRPYRHENQEAVNCSIDRRPMRGLAFKIVTQTSAWLIWLITFVNTVSLKVVGNIGYFLMNLIDKKRVEMYSQLLEGFEQPGMSELESQAMELRLLASANQVRDHAKETEDWTDRHTEALNAIGDALISEAGWQEDSVHQYLKGLVESIDGLEYGTEEF